MSGRPEATGDVPTVVFAGGRGARALVDRLLGDPRIALTLVINGYDDGASTGEVRRFLGDALGPSDFRKNAGRAARTLGSAGDALIDLLDWRLPDPCPPAAASSLLAEAIARLQDPMRHRIAAAVAAFEAERDRTDRPFAFGDCAIGNLVFAGLFLAEGRRFNDAVAAYATLLGLPAGLIANVSDGGNAHLAAIDGDGGLLATEAAIVDARCRNRVQSIVLLDREPPLELGAAPVTAIDAWLTAHAVTPRLNPRVAARLAEASLIVFAPGTQHSSLFPSYLTDGLGEAIAANQQALKLLVTNLQPDAETADASAVDIVERALHYLRRRGEVPLAAPTLITHSLINEPRRVASGPLYVPPGAVRDLADPRRAWVHDFEAGTSGRHDGTKVLDPFLDGVLGARMRPRVALPFPLVGLAGDVPHAFAEAADGWRADYVASFDSSGMYWGEDLVRLLAQVPLGRPAAVWGSRRLSVRDVHASYRVRYRRQRWLGVASYAGSHVLSLLYLVLYGRYVSDTLSAVRIVARRHAAPGAWPPGHPRAAHVLLSAVLRDQAELRELPVRFLSLPASRARRTRVVDGLAAIALIVALRLRRPARPKDATAPVPALAPPAA